MRAATLFIVSLLLCACGADVGSTALSARIASQPPPSTASQPPAATTGSMSGLANMVIESADGRVVVVRSSTMSEPARGLVAADDATLITTTVEPWGASTVVRWMTLGDGLERARTSLAGDLTAVAADPVGKVVAFVGRNPEAANGTEIVIATADGEQFRAGYRSELQPEGFSNIFSRSTRVPDGLFVIEYLDPPPDQVDAARRYRVRVLDTSSGELGLPLNLRDKAQTVDEEMLGFGRTHVMSSRNGLLFTLYRGAEDSGDDAASDAGGGGGDGFGGYDAEADDAFVHTLGFVNGVWCLDLPVELGLGLLPGALVVADDESRLIVSSANGFMTEFVIGDITDPTREPLPRRTVHVWDTDFGISAPAVSSNADEILIGQGEVLHWVDEATFTERAAQQWDMLIDSVALMPNGNAVAAGSGRISEISPTGELVGEQPLPAGFDDVTRIVLLDAN